MHSNYRSFASRQFTFAIASFLLISGGLISTPLAAETSGSEISQNNLLTVSDCKGQMRLSQKIGEADNVNLSFELSNPVEKDAKAILSPKNDSLLSKNGVVAQTGTNITFQEVTSGNWSLCDDNGEMVPFRSVQVLENNTNTAGIGAGVVGTSVAAIGTAAAIAVGSSDAFSGSSSSDQRGGAGTAPTTANSDNATTDSVLDAGPEISNASENANGDFGSRGDPLSPAS